jgi:hypothetical protein
MAIRADVEHYRLVRLKRKTQQRRAGVRFSAGALQKEHLSASKTKSVRLQKEKQHEKRCAASSMFAE